MVCTINSKDRCLTSCWHGGLSGYVARYCNVTGHHAAAKHRCERAIAEMRLADRPFVAMFLSVELELSVADAGLGHTDLARARLDDLLVLHGRSDNPLTRGRIHEAYARASALAGDWESFRHHLEETRNWFKRTGTSALISQAERLRTLDLTRSEPPPMGAARLSPATRQTRKPAALDPARVSDAPAAPAKARTEDS